MLQGKAAKLDSYIDPLLREFGFSDTEIAEIRATADADFKASSVAGQRPELPPSPARTSSMVSSTARPGEEADFEVFGGAPLGQNTRTLTQAVQETVASPGTIRYTPLGGQQVMGGVRVQRINASDGFADAPLDTLSFRANPTTAASLEEMLAQAHARLGAGGEPGLDAEGSPIQSVVKLPGHWVIGEKHATQGVRFHDGMFAPDHMGMSPEVAEATIKQMLRPAGTHATTYDGGTPTDRSVTYAFTTSEGHLVVANFGRDASSFAMADRVSVYSKDGPLSPEATHKLLGRLGITDRRYADEGDWQEEAAELLVRQLDGGPLNYSDSVAVRLQRVASEWGVGLTDLEVFYDSMGRMRYRIKEDRWPELKQKMGLGEVGYIWKAVGTGDPSQPGANLERILKNGVLSKVEQVVGGTGTHAGGAGGGSSPLQDLASGGASSVYMGTTMADGRTPSSWVSSSYQYVLFDADQLLREIGWSGTVGGDWAYGVQNPEDSHFQKPQSDTYITLPGQPHQYTYPQNVGSSKLFEYMHPGSAPPEAIIGVLTIDSTQRNALLDRLEAAGITEINGVPVSDLVVSRSSSTYLDNARSLTNGINPPGYY